MNQLLMVCTELSELPVVVPEKYTPHNFTRGGDDVLNENEFKEQWISIRECVQDRASLTEWFDVVYYDKRVPDDGFFIVLDENGGLVSSSAIQIGEHTPDSSTLHAVFTDNRHRGKGLGKAVTCMAVNYAVRHGIKTMYLTTDDYRIPAIKLYLGIGFAPVLYESDMSKRWRDIMRILNITDQKVIDGQGGAAVISI